MLKIPGQRWFWTNTGYEHIVEVLADGTSMTIQVIGREVHSDLTIGKIRGYLDFTNYGWVYLVGQDRPKD